MNKITVSISNLLEVTTSWSWPVRILVGAGTFLTSGVISAVVLSKLKPRRKLRPKPYDLWNTGIFFPCYFPEDPDGSFAQLLGYISSADRTLKICVMTLNYDRLINAIIMRKKAGVKVQVFTSYHCANSGFVGRRFREAGIPVRSLKKSESEYSTIMHHKYMIVDDEAVLTGSMNWTELSVTQQRENILVTTDDRIVPKFVKHFDELWKQNDWDVDGKQ